MCTTWYAPLATDQPQTYCTIYMRLILVIVPKCEESRRCKAVVDEAYSASVQFSQSYLMILVDQSPSTCTYVSVCRLMEHAHICRCAHMSPLTVGPRAFSCLLRAERATRTGNDYNLCRCPRRIRDPFVYERRLHSWPQSSPQKLQAGIARRAKPDAVEAPLHRNRGTNRDRQIVVDKERLIELRQSGRQRAQEDGILAQLHGGKDGAT